MRSAGLQAGVGRDVARVSFAPARARLAVLRRGLPVALAASWWVGCGSLGPASREDAAGASLPERFRAAGGVPRPPDRWWQAFRSPELNRLVERALAGNLSIAQAAARLRQADAAARKAGASRSPEVSLTAEAARLRRRSEVTSPGEPSRQETTSSERYGLGLAASYELDLWGRVRASRASAALSALSSRQDLEATAMTLAGEVADLWLKQAEYRGQLRILEAQRESNRTALQLIRLRQRKSLASALDAYQQEQVLAQTEALLPQVRSQLDTALRQLAVLVGAPPGTPLGLEAADLPEPPELPAAGLPADLLARRPDLEAAYLRLRAAGSEARAARADRLPALRLTGAYAYEASTLDALLDNWLLNLAAGLAAPLLDGGRRQAEADRAEALADERLAAYRAAVLAAIREVEDALAGERHQVERLAATEREFGAADRSLREAEERYRKGVLQYLPVLQALAARQRLERELLTQRRQRLSTRVQLYRALGGAWTEDLALHAHQEDPVP